MNVFKTIFSIDAKNIFAKRKVFIYLVILLILILLINEGESKYLSNTENKKVFQRMETEKVKQYVFYDQFAGYGIKILFIPSPLSIMFSDSIIDEAISNINIGERLNISMSFSKGFSVKNPGFMDFSGIILIFAVIYSLICGYEITKKSDYLKVLSRLSFSGNVFFYSFISNIILINAVFLFLIGFCLLLLFINGINLFNVFLAIFVLGIIMFISFLFATGTIIGGINIEKSTKGTILTILIILFIFFIPLFTYKINQMIGAEIESISSLEFKNFKILMEAEDRISNEIGIYKNDGKEAPEKVKKIIERDKKTVFKKIKQNENNRKNNVLNGIRANQTLLSLFPVTFVISLNKSLSSYGGINYIDFYSYSQIVKDDFRNFILKKKFFEKAKPGKVEPFTTIDDDKNVFFAKSHLPFNFWIGVLSTLFYTVMLLFISYRIHKKRQKIPEPTKAYEIETEKGPLFVLCENESIKEDIFNDYENKKESVCLEKIETSDFQFNGVKANKLLKHFSQVCGIDETKALENLKHMGIRDLTGLPVCHEIILKIYAAVQTAVDRQLIVINDFLRNESRELERDFLNLLLFLEKAGKKIIYLSTQVYQTKGGVNNFDESIEVDKFESIEIDLDTVILR